MRLTRTRMLFAGAIGVAAVAIPVSVPFAASQLGGGVASPSTPVSPDVVTYNQTATTAGTNVQYVPAGNTANATTQTVTPSGKCGTPTVSGAPLLALAGLLYPADTDTDTTVPDTDDYSGSPSPVPVGSSHLRTGVCAVGPANQIDNSPGRGQEALDLSVGSNTVMGTNRIFSDARITLLAGEETREEDRGPSAIPVQLVEYLAGSHVATQTCSISGDDETPTVVDTNTNAVCTGTTALRGFDTVSVEVPLDETGVSVVGTSTFTLAPQVCGGQSITSTGPVSATLKIAPNGGCQSYTAFTSTTSPSGTLLTYDEFSPGTTVPFSFVIPWSNQPECQPGLDPTVNTTSSPLPQCAPTQVSLDGMTYTDQTYCAVATAAQPLCTVNKDYNYVLGADGVTTFTQITETWSGLVDWVVRH